MNGQRFDAWTRRVRQDASRRHALQLTLGAGLGFLLGTPEPLVAKRKKPRCRNGAERCGKDCCGQRNRCRRNVCYCIGKKGARGADARRKRGCVEVQEVVIEIIAEVTGRSPGFVGAEPEKPLEDRLEIDDEARQKIDQKLEKEFGIKKEAPYYNKGIDAARAVIEAALKKG